MILYIAEKPSLGRALAAALPKPHRKGEGCIHLGNGDVVSWCIGHLLEQAEPDAYDPEFKKWRLEHLPITPDTWQLVPKPKTRKQLNILRKLVKQSQHIVHVGDPDREGQLLVDEVINYFKVPQSKRNTIKRCLISDLNISAVKRALQTLRSNNDFIALSISALARSRADWLYGMNMSRLCTIQGSKAGYNGVLSVGRVQTPVLGLVVKRDLDIENFVSKPFYEVWAHVKTIESTAEPIHFKAKWQPSEACQPYQDNEGRVLSLSLAQNVAQRITGQPGTVTQFSRKNKKQSPPLPYSLSILQIDAAKRFGMSAKKVLDVCQSLYEKHKLITYPRSDCRYLPREHLQFIPQVTQAIASVSPELSSAVKGADLKRVSKAWNDNKVEAHHAIIPTSKGKSTHSLTKDESNIYQLISRQYLMQLYADFTFEERLIILNISHGVFTAKSKQPLEMGWKKLITTKKSSKPLDNKDEELQSYLPTLKKGDAVLCESSEIIDKKTQPPKHFTDATLLSAMTGINRFVKAPDIRKILKETDGLGTEATRAGIIELLFKRSYFERQGKQIRSTLIGRKLIASLPESTTLPDMTAKWESQLSSMAQRGFSYQRFMSELLTNLNTLISQVDSQSFLALKGAGKKTTFKKTYAKKKFTSKKRKYYKKKK